MEAFKIWSTLNIRGNALEQMEKFTILSVKASKEINLIQKNLGLLSKEFNILGTGLMKDNIEIKAFGENLSSVSRRTTNLIGKTEKLAMSLKSVAASGAAATGSMAGMGAGRVGGGGLLSKGNVALFGAYEVEQMIHHSFDAQKEYQMHLLQLKGLGFNNAQIARADKLGHMNIPGISPNQMIESVVAAQMATRAGPGQFGEVEMMAPELAKSAMALRVTYGKDMSQKQINDIIRVAEIQGGSSPTNQLKWLRTATSMMLSSGGTITPAKQLQFSQLTAGSTNLTPESYLALEPVLQELQSRTGTGITTGNRALLSQIPMTGFSKKQMQFWQKLGLYKDEYTTTGRPLGVHMPKAYADIARSSPDLFIKDILIPILAKGGITSEKDVMAALENFPRTYSQFAKTYYKNRVKVDRSRELSKHILSGEDLQTAVKEAPGFATAQFSASFERFSLSFGAITAPTVIWGMNKLSLLFEDLAMLFSSEIWTKAAGELRTFVGGSITDNQKKNTASMYQSPFMSSVMNKITAIGEPDKNQSPIIVKGDVFLDKYKVGDITMSNMNDQLSRAGTSSSTAAFNPSYGMPVVGLTNYGGQQ